MTRATRVKISRVTQAEFRVVLTGDLHRFLKPFCAVGMIKPTLGREAVLVSATLLSAQLPDPSKTLLHVDLVHRLPTPPTSCSMSKLRPDS